MRRRLTRSHPQLLTIPQLAEELAAEDVVFEGYVQDLGEVFSRCRVAVAPLVSGAGIKGKVIDALSYGVPQVLSPLAAEGTGLRHGSEVLVAQEPVEWAEMVTKLYQDDAAWQAMSQAALAYARQAYSFERGQELMRKALEVVDVYCSPDQHALVASTARPKFIRH